MDWDRMRLQWQQRIPPASVASVAELQARDRAVERKVRRRDLYETAAAAIAGLFFAFVAWEAAHAAEWAVFGFALLLVAYAVFVPLRLRHARRQVPERAGGLSLLDCLRRRREAALAQARMLEQVWLWYVLPPTVGIVGLTLARGGTSTFGLVYIAVVLVFMAGVVWLNRYAANKHFRAHAEQIRHQIDALTREGGA